METLLQFDRQLFHFVNQTLANGVLDVICLVIRNKLAWIPLYIFIAWAVYQDYGKHIILVAAFAGITVLLTDQISSSVVKPWFHRIRPCNNLLMDARLVVDYCSDRFSFVSSHATNHFGIAVFLSSLYKNRVLASLLLCTWAGAICFAQVYVGLHYPADVFGGAVLGITIGLTTAFANLKCIDLYAGKINRDL
jgi:membrane-associated phospholipid phosphatase